MPRQDHWNCLRKATLYTFYANVTRHWSEWVVDSGAPYWAFASRAIFDCATTRDNTLHPQSLPYPLIYHWFNWLTLPGCRRTLAWGQTKSSQAQPSQASRSAYEHVRYQEEGRRWKRRISEIASLWNVPMRIAKWTTTMQCTLCPSTLARLA